MATINCGAAGVGSAAFALRAGCACAIEVESNSGRRKLCFFHIISVPCGIGVGVHGLSCRVSRPSAQEGAKPPLWNHRQAEETGCPLRVPDPLRGFLIVRGLSVEDVRHKRLRISIVEWVDRKS